MKGFAYPLWDPYATASVLRRREKSKSPSWAKKNRTFFKLRGAQMLAEFKSAFPKGYKALYLLKAGYLVCQGEKFSDIFFLLFSLLSLALFPLSAVSPPLSLPPPSPSLPSTSQCSHSATSASWFLTLTLPCEAGYGAKEASLLSRSRLFAVGPWVGTFSWPFFPHSVQVNMRARTSVWACDSGPVCAWVCVHVCIHFSMKTFCYREELCGPSSLSECDVFALIAEKESPSCVIPHPELHSLSHNYRRNSKKFLWTDPLFFSCLLT